MEKRRMSTFEKFYCEVGAARSGTNFLGELLSQHPMLAYWRRPKYIWRHGNAWKPDDCLTPRDARPRVKRYIRRRFSQYMRSRGKDRLLVCTQANCLALAFVNEVFPEGKIIHIIRDGREVAASQNREWTIHVRPEAGFLIFRRAKEVPISDWPAYVGELLGTLYLRWTKATYRYSMGPKIRNWKQSRRSLDSLEFSALNWNTCVTAARRVGATMPKDRYYEVRYEHLVREPEKAVPPLLAFMELPPAPEVDDFIANRIDKTTVGKWLDRLSDEDMNRILPHMREQLESLGIIEKEQITAG
jgi:hypothetical protein